MATPPNSISIQPPTVLRLGYAVLASCLIIGLTLTVFIAWAAPDVAVFFPILLIGAIGIVVIFQYPTANLFVVLSSFFLIADFEAGFQVSEILYGLYYLGFLAHWFFTRLVLYKEKVFRRPEERVLAIFLVLVTLTFPLTIIFDGSLSGFVSEWLSLSFLGFYFPVREAIERDRNGLIVVLGSVILVGLFVLIRNVANFQDVISGAEYAFEVARGRAVTNESLLIVPSVICLVFMLFQKRLIPRLFFAGLFLVFFAGVLLTQSRGYWMAFLFAAFVVLILVPPRQRLLLLGSGVLTIAGVIVVGVLLFGDAILLLVYGVAERFLSILTSTSSDISLVNRFTESLGVWKYVRMNPILGYGLGVEYRVYDIIYDATIVKTFIHNGYIALLYKFGIWGTGMLVYFFWSVLRRAHSVYRSYELPLRVRIAGLAVVASFACYMISALTSNPIFINDAMFVIAVVTGVAAGCWSIKTNYASDVIAV